MTAADPQAAPKIKKPSPFDFAPQPGGAGGAVANQGATNAAGGARCAIYNAEFYRWCGSALWHHDHQLFFESDNAWYLGAVGKSANFALFLWSY